MRFHATPRAAVKIFFTQTSWKFRTPWIERFVSKVRFISNYWGELRTSPGKETALRLSALIAMLVGGIGAVWSWHLLQWYISANTLTACILGTQCPLVFQTSFSYFYGVPIHLLAIGWFSLMTVIAGLRVFGVQRASAVGVVIGALCVPAIAYLDYIQLAVIHAICSDCELAHILGLIVFVLFILIYRSDRRNLSGIGEKA